MIVRKRIVALTWWLVILLQMLRPSGRTAHGVRSWLSRREEQLSMTLTGSRSCWRRSRSGTSLSNVCFCCHRIPCSDIFLYVNRGVVLLGKSSPNWRRRPRLEFLLVYGMLEFLVPCWISILFEWSKSDLVLCSCEPISNFIKHGCAMEICRNWYGISNVDCGKCAVCIYSHLLSCLLPVFR